MRLDHAHPDAFKAHQENGRVAFPYNTEVYWGYLTKDLET